MADVKPLKNNAGGGTEFGVGDTVGVANGGTGGTTTNGALANLLPSQTGNSGKTLSTNGTNTAWVYPIGSSSLIIKQADESTASSSLQADDDFVVPIAVNERIKLYVLAVINANGSGGFKWDFTAPAGASGTASMTGASANFRSGLVAIGTGGGSTTTISDATYIISCDITNGSTAGNIALRWAQNVTFATPTILRLGSVCLAVKVA